MNKNNKNQINRRSTGFTCIYIKSIMLNLLRIDTACCFRYRKNKNKKKCINSMASIEAIVFSGIKTKTKFKQTTISDMEERSGKGGGGANEWEREIGIGVKSSQLKAIFNHVLLLRLHDQFFADCREERKMTLVAAKCSAGRAKRWTVKMQEKEKEKLEYSRVKSHWTWSHHPNLD